MGFISKWEVGPTVYFTCNCEANWVKGNCGKCFLPTCETAIKLFKDGSMQSNGVSINRTELKRGNSLIGLYFYFYFYFELLPFYYFKNYKTLNQYIKECYFFFILPS